MINLRKMNRASGLLFVLGFLASKINSAPFLIVSLVNNHISLFFYFAGYLCWIIASFIYPKEPRDKNAWYGFSQYKQQNIYAAVIGAIAILCSGIAIAFPAMIIPGLWLFALSNLFWCIAEYHHYKSPPTDNDDLDNAYQHCYFVYTLYSFNSSITAAFGATLSILFPPLTMVFLPTAFVINTILLIVTVYYGIDFIETFIEKKIIEDETFSQYSYWHILERLKILDAAEVLQFIPKHTANLFAQKKPEPSSLKPQESETNRLNARVPSPLPTCRGLSTAPTVFKVKHYCS